MEEMSRSNDSFKSKESSSNPLKKLKRKFNKLRVSTMINYYGKDKTLNKIRVGDSQPASSHDMDGLY